MPTCGYIKVQPDGFKEKAAKSTQKWDPVSKRFVVCRPFQCFPDNIGYDVFVIMGQSNAVGIGGNSFYTNGTGVADVGDEYLNIDKETTSGIKQWRRYNDDDSLFSSSNPNDYIIDARDLLDHNMLFTSSDTSVYGSRPSNNAGNGFRGRQVGFAYTFAKEYTNRTGRNVLLVPTARNGTSSLQWSKGAGDLLYDNALNRTIAAVNSKPNNRLCGILWHQGESDAIFARGQSGATFEALRIAFIDRVTAIINTFRSDIAANGITGNKVISADIPWLLGGFTIPWINSTTLNDAQRANLNAFYNTVKAIGENTTAGRTFINTAWITSGIVGDGLGENANLPVIGANGIHFNATGQRIFGKRYFNVYYNRFGSLI